MRALVLAGLVMGVSLAGAADDPPKKLTPEERRELEAKAAERSAAGLKAYQAQKPDEAERAFREALAMQLRLYPGRDHPDVAAGLNNLAVVLIALGRPAEAEPL